MSKSSKKIDVSRSVIHIQTRKRSNDVSVSGSDQSKNLSTERKISRRGPNLQLSPVSQSCFLLWDFDLDHKTLLLSPTQASLVGLVMIDNNFDRI